MGIKEQNLRDLERRGWNIHNYILYKPKDIDSTKEFIENYYKTNKSFSIRTDKSFGNIDNLPFILIEDIIDYNKLDKFIRDSIDNNLELIITDGRQYDKYLMANIVISIEGETVYIDVNSQNIPLRLIYKYPKEISRLEGSIFDKLEQFKKAGKDLSISLDDLNMVYEYVLRNIDIKDKYIELSLYTQPVGKRNKRIVCWQTK